MLDREHFLLEAKWQREKSDLGNLRDLDAAVSSSLDNTPGLFVAVSGFTEDALSGYIEVLMLFLDGRIDLPELLFRKKEVAAQQQEDLRDSKRHYP